MNSSSDLILQLCYAFHGAKMHFMHQSLAQVQLDHLRCDNFVIQNGRNELSYLQLNSKIIRRAITNELN